MSMVQTSYHSIPMLSGEVWFFLVFKSAYGANSISQQSHAVGLGTSCLTFASLIASVLCF